MRAAIERYYRQLRRSTILRPPIPPPVVVTLALVYAEAGHHWHPLASHHDLVQLVSDGAVVVLLLWVVLVGIWTRARVYIASP